ncbi:MAG: hypothetical protein ISR58_19260 [Anaerolineales bacterium]|nr:hypothetical protein [Chloroflexota bacterium]MBL6983322.1 hypothetical protein [Anaerolineales bacterium]
MSDDMQFLYTIQPTRPAMLTEGPTSEEDRIVSEHFNYLKSLNGQGILILAGRTQNSDPSSFGIVIFKAASEEDAKQIMENDPAVSQGVMKAEIYPYRVALITEEREGL